MDTSGKMDKVTRLPLDHDRAVERRRLHIREVSEGEAEAHASVGAELRAARQRLGEDLRAVASALRIRPDHLEAIEEGAFDRLPVRAYAIGFVRAYAEYLGLDPATIVARFKTEAGSLVEPTLDPVVVEATEEEVHQPQGLLIILLILFAVAVAGGFYFANSAGRILSRNSQEGAPSAAPAPAAEMAPVSVSSTPAIPETAAQAPTLPAPASQPPTSQPSTGQAPTGQASAPQAPSEVGRVFGATADPSARVAVHALRDGVWFRVEDQTSGEVLITRKLKAGDRYIVPSGRPNLVLVTRDGGALELTLDGITVGRAGGNGTIIDGLALNPDFLAGRLPPPAPPPASAAPPMRSPAVSPPASVPAKPATPPAAKAPPAPTAAPPNPGVPAPAAPDAGVSD